MNTKISDAAVGVFEAAYNQEWNRSPANRLVSSSIRASNIAGLEAVLTHLAADAVPVAWLIERIAGKGYGRDNYVVMRGQASSDPDSHLFWADQAARDSHRLTPLYIHPQPAALNEVSGNSGELGGDERARFEAWARPRFPEAEVFDRIHGRPGGWEYNGNYVQAAWAGWQAALAACQPVGQEPRAWLIHWSHIPLEAPEATTSATRVDAVGALTDPPRIEPLYAAPPAQGVDLGPIATRKLGELAARGYVANGVAIFNPATGQRGLVDNLGFVGWVGAQGIDLGQFRDLIGFAVLNAIYLPESDPRRDFIRQADELLALIDSQRDAVAGVG